MKRILVTLILIFSFINLYSTTVKSFSGKVKVRYEGESAWSEITVGLELPANATVSTGFNSKIVLDLGNSTTVDVLPLTRMTVGEITENGDSIKTSLTLQGGKITADVGKIEGKITDFRIKSPVATASVRGTKFSFTGNSLVVTRGVVAFAPTVKEPGSGEAVNDIKFDDNKSVAVRAGGRTELTAPGGKPVKPQVAVQKVREVRSSTKPVVLKRDRTPKSVTNSEIKDSAPVPGEVKSNIEGFKRVKIEVAPIEYN